MEEVKRKILPKETEIRKLKLQQYAKKMNEKRAYVRKVLNPSSQYNQQRIRDGYSLSQSPEPNRYSRIDGSLKDHITSKVDMQNQSLYQNSLIEDKKVSARGENSVSLLEESSSL